MTRRRLAAATILALAAAGTFGASAATADTSGTAVRAAGGQYIACVGVRTVNVATCVEEPVGPVLDLLPL